MHINARKALIALALVTSCSAAFTPQAAKAADLPTIVVVGSRPQSEADIRNFLDGLRPPSWTDVFDSILPDGLGGGGEEITADFSVTLYYFNGCSASQQVRTDVVAREISSAVNTAAANNRSSGYQMGTVVDINYNDSGSERFVVTSVTTSAVVIAPIEGSFTGCP